MKSQPAPASSVDLHHLDASLDGIYGIDAHGITFANRATCELLGYRLDELVGKAGHELFHHTRRDGSPYPIERCPIYTALTSQTSHSVLGELFWRRDGTAFPVDYTASPVLKGGETVGVTVVFRDASGRERVERALRDRERDLLAAQRLAQIGSWRWDLETNAVDWSDECFRLLGYEPGEVEPSFDRYLEFVHPDDRAEFRALVEESLAIGAPQRFEYRGVRPDGEVRWLISHSAVTREGSGEPAQVHGTIQDITETRVLERQLRLREAQLVEAERVARMASWSCDLDGSDFVSSSTLPLMVGIEPDDFEPSFASLIELTHPDDRDLVASIRARVQEGQTPVECEHRLITPGGRRMTLLSRVEIVQGDRGAGRLVGTARDVTDERRDQALARMQEAKLHETERLESVGRLAGGIAHEFNNLLTVILNYALIARTDAKEGKPVEEALTEIARSAKSAAGLTQGLLAFSRGDPQTSTACAPNEILEHLERLMGHVLGEGIWVELALDPDTGWVGISGDQLEQIVWNLLLNARDAMPDGGVVTIRTSGGAATVRIAVTDSGEGMSAEVAARAFEPFFTTKPRGQGTGFGLATVYGRVRQAGGEVRLDTRPGEGTTIELELPAVPAPSPQTGWEPEERELDGAGRLVLIVEDDEALRTLTCDMLERKGFRCLAASNVGAAIGLCERHAGELALVLTDLVMPGAPGSELASEVRRRWPEIPVVYMSGYLDQVAAIDLEDPVLAKPFSPGELARALTSAFAQQIRSEAKP